MADLFENPMGLDGFDFVELDGMQGSTGAGGADAMVRDFNVELLGKLPLDARIREQADSGNPTVASEPDSPAAEAFGSAARRMAAALAMQGKDYSAKFPKIVVE